MRKELELAATLVVLEDLGRACRVHCRAADVAACATGRILDNITGDVEATAAGEEMSVVVAGRT